LGATTISSIYKDIYEQNLKSTYFLKDLYNYNNISYIFYYLNLTSFSDKLFFFVMYIFDTSFFYLYQLDCFPKTIRRYLEVLYYTSIYMVFYEFEEFDKISHEFIENLNIVNFYLK